MCNNRGWRITSRGAIIECECHGDFHDGIFDVDLLEIYTTWPPSISQSVTLDPIPWIIKNKYGLVKVPVHFNVYQPKCLTKCPFGLVADKANVTDKHDHNHDTPFTIMLNVVLNVRCTFVFKRSITH